MSKLWSNWLTTNSRNAILREDLYLDSSNRNVGIKLSKEAKKLLSPKAGALSVLSYSPAVPATYQKQIPNIQSLLLHLEGKGRSKTRLKQ